MASARLTHVVVYADREHFTSIAWLTNFDPRFEEAILIVADSGKPLVVVGNECEAYLGVSPLYTAGKLRSERFQPLSLRWIYVHMIEEYARHNGHADLIRELIDGSTGW